MEDFAAPMKIVHVVNGYLPEVSEGVQTHVNGLAAAQSAAGDDVEIFTRSEDATRPEFAVWADEWAGLRVVRLNNRFGDLDAFEKLYTHPEIDWRFDEYLATSKPDLVHVHHLTCLSTSMISVARRRRIPVVMTLHDHWMTCMRGQRIHPDNLQICESRDRAQCLRCLHALWPHLLPVADERPGWRRWFSRTSNPLDAWERHARDQLSACQLLLTPSAFHREVFVRWGLPADSIVALPLGLDHRRLAAAPRGRAAVERVGYVGTVIPSKGLHVLAEAFAMLGRPELSLEVYGGAPSYHGDTGYLERIREKLPTGARVRFHGRYQEPELPAILASIDVLVVPSIWWESYCLTLREGALAGLPVIASRLGAMGEAVDAELAIGFCAGDAADLARTLGRVIDDADLRDGLSRRGGLVADRETYQRRLQLLYEKARQASS